MWVEAMGGKLINLDKATYIDIVVQGRLGYPKATHSLTASIDDGEPLCLYWGTLEECETAKAALPMPIAWRAGKLEY